MKKTKNEELDSSSSQAVRDLGLLFLTQEQKDFLDKCVKDAYDEDGDYLWQEGGWEFNEDGTVYIVGDFNCSDMGLTDFMGIKFSESSDIYNFDCSNNQLTSLEGAPKEIEGGFDCGNNQLTSLEGAPEKVNGDFRCNFNKLTSLVGAPKEVCGDFRCSYNQLTSLEGAPNEVTGSFDCRNNPLTSLEGLPTVLDEEDGGEGIVYVPANLNGELKMREARLELRKAEARVEELKKKLEKWEKYRS